MANASDVEEILRLYLIFCPNCLNRLPADDNSYRKNDKFVLLYPRSGERIDHKRECSRILGIIKNVVFYERKMTADLVLTPNETPDKQLKFRIRIYEDPSVDPSGRGGRVVAKIVRDPYQMDNCQGELYDFYYFGDYLNIPKIIWKDSWISMTEFQWKKLQNIVN